MNNYRLGFELLVIGMGTVFISLYLLSVFLYFSGKFFGTEAKKKTANPGPEKQQLNSSRLAEKPQISRQKVAAITAAVAEIQGEKEFKVISIRPKS
jgi:sodium pump decarboxylase gamma subunit